MRSNKPAFYCSFQLQGTTSSVAVTVWQGARRPETFSTNMSPWEKHPRPFQACDPSSPSAATTAVKAASASWMPNDHSVPLIRQTINTLCSGVDWTAKEMNVSHRPFPSRWIFSKSSALIDRIWGEPLQETWLSGLCMYVLRCHSPPSELCVSNIISNRSG